MKFRDIPQMSRANYAIDVSVSYLKSTLDSYHEHYALDFDPPFQRHYVWTDAQRTAYVEYILKGGMSGRDIYLNAPHWMAKSRMPKLTLVDGKQRLNALLDFLDDKVPVFGGVTYAMFTDQLSPMEPSLKFHINDLDHERDVVRWYIDMNTGGSIHTPEDVQKAKDYLATLA